MATIIDQLKYRYKNGDVLVKFIFINVAVFLILKVISVFFILFNVRTVDLIVFLGVPSELSQLLNRFWTPFSYMFVHEQFWHLLVNMIGLYWFGRIFLQYFSGRVLGSLYVLGGLAGAFLYLAAFNLIPYFVGLDHSWMIGASASVMAIVMGAAFYRPNVQLNLFLLGQIKIIYIAIVFFLIDFLSLGNGINEGGHVAHIGGAIAGYIFAWQYRNGRDITGWVSKMLDGLANLTKPRRKKSKMKVEYRRAETDMEYNERKHSEQAEIDAILDKLKQSGYSNLSSEEKRKLFDASKK
ncbi:MAG: rhomboid family intramembrane serine protease [Bacteroidia bacterium]|nr:rhomboid family intramembrane serine protease [Bacteroidia bacterium]